MDEVLLFFGGVGALIVLIRLSTFSTRLTKLERELHLNSETLKQLSENVNALKQHYSSSATPIQSEPAPKFSSSESKETEVINSIEKKIESDVFQVFKDEDMAIKGPSQIVVNPVKSTTNKERFLSNSFFKNIKSSSEWETLIGGNILNRIGAIALIFGIGFFLKYAFDNNLISPMVRVIIGVSLGFGLIAGGSRAFSKKFETFSQGLFGAGISTLYLSIYASINFYQLLPESIAFVLMSVVTALALVIAIRYDSIAISLLGCVGGFLTPLLLNSTEPNAVGLFVYLFLLNVGLLAVVSLKTEWIVIELISIVATWVIYMEWGSTFGTNTNIVIRSAFLIMIWMVYLASEAIRAIQNDQLRFSIRSIISTLTALFFFVGLYDAFEPSGWLGFIMLIVVFIYTTIFYLIQKVNTNVSQKTLTSYCIASAFFLAAAVEVQFGDFITVALWSIEAIGILWIAFKFSDHWLHRAALVLYSLTFVRLFISPDALSYQQLSEFTPLFNLRMVGYFLIILSIALGSYVLRKNEKNQTAAFFDYIWTFLAFAWMTIEINDIFLKREYQLSENLSYTNSTRAMSLAIVWFFYSMLLVWIGIERALKTLVSIGFILLGIGIFWNVVFGFMYEPIVRFVPILNVRALSYFIAIGGSVALIAKLERRGEGHSSLAQLLRYGSLLLLFLLFTTEVLDYYRFAINNGGGSGEYFNQALSLSFFWGLYAISLVYVGLLKQIKAFIHLGNFAFTLAVSTTMIFGFSFKPIQNFQLIFNYRFLVIVFLMLGGAFIAIQFSKNNIKLSSIYGITSALLGVVLLTVESNDFFGQKIDLLSFGVNADATTKDLIDLYQNQKQLSISGSLMIYSILLMFYGIWRSRQPIRLTSMALFGLVILKIFIYDLSFLTTLYRIFSFIGLGVLLLTVSYLYQRFKDLIIPVIRPAEEHQP